MSLDRLRRAELGSVCRHVNTDTVAAEAERVPLALADGRHLARHGNVKVRPRNQPELEFVRPLA
ncbi:hypothetical protein QUS91_22450, partial [Xanthomonas citri pv. citri]